MNLLFSSRILSNSIDSAELLTIKSSPEISKYLLISLIFGKIEKIFGIILVVGQTVITTDGYMKCI